MIQEKLSKEMKEKLITFIESGGDLDLITSQVNIIELIDSVDVEDVEEDSDIETLSDLTDSLKHIEYLLNAS